MSQNQILPCEREDTEMEIAFYTDADAVYVEFQDRHPTGGRILDLARHVDLGPHGETIAVEFLGVSKGVDLNDIPGVSQQDVDALARKLSDANILIKSSA